VKTLRDLRRGQGLWLFKESIGPKKTSYIRIWEILGLEGSVSGLGNLEELKDQEQDGLRHFLGRTLLSGMGGN